MSGVTRQYLQEIAARPSLAGSPVLATLDFRRSQPQLTMPIGGQAKLKADAASAGSSLRLSDH